MKLLKIIFLLGISTVLSAQNMNQFDSNGKRHGIWKKTFKNSNILRYEGEFFHGKEIGLFKFYKNINKKALLTATKEFNKENNKASVKFLSSKGKIISEGQMNGKTYIGTWKYYQKRSNKLLILEHYNNQGKLEGDRFVYYANGQIAEKQFYNNGKLDSLSVSYSEKNIILKEYRYNKGELNGLSKIYTPKGHLIVEGVYKNDKKYGVWKYYKNNKLIEEKDFSHNSNGANKNK